jgi:hypothetical protein
MGNHDKRLVVALAKSRALLPPIILPNDQGSYAVLNQQIDAGATGGMQIRNRLGRGQRWSQVELASSGALTDGQQRDLAIAAMRAALTPSM